ncbi:MAG: hypothetical protein ACREKG_12650 [Candidatus Rokuibacteriota bacterium]
MVGHLRLDLADRHLPVGPDQEEEDLEPGEVREGLEGLRVLVIRLELSERQPTRLFMILHISNYGTLVKS